MKKKTFVGFGFGAIQGGLFLYEARRSGNFDRLVVAEVMQDVVDVIRKAGGKYSVNVAEPAGIRTHVIDGLEILNPKVPADQKLLLEAVEDASEIATALPSVKFYGIGINGDVTDILATGLMRKLRSAGAPDAVIYTAENHNHAAEILEEDLQKRLGDDAQKIKDRYQCLNTVIGKMSGVITDLQQIREQGLSLIAPGISRAFLVEEFNRILISRISLKGFERGIRVFEEKEDLLPFEEAKLYGHNATHALIGYMLRLKGRTLIADAGKDKQLMRSAREAFLLESGKALCKKYAGLDPLFTDEGYRAYTDDLLTRMVNPHLRDTVERITRDPKRKLGWDDRLIGTIRMIMEQDIIPRRYAMGAAAALQILEKEEDAAGPAILNDIWHGSSGTEEDRKKIQQLINQAKESL